VQRVTLRNGKRVDHQIDVVSSVENDRLTLDDPFAHIIAGVAIEIGNQKQIRTCIHTRHAVAECAHPDGLIAIRAQCL
jgi:hypothetical protein